MKNKLFSKALFKQSIKANGVMWSIITVAVCFMLACVMLISGTGNISEVKVGVEDTIIQQLIAKEIDKTSISLYDMSNSSEELFDKYYAKEYKTVLSGATTVEEQTAAPKQAYLLAINDLTNYISEVSLQKAKEENTNATKESVEYKDIYEQFYGAAMFTINPNGAVNSTYTGYNELIPEDYDVTSIVLKATQDVMLNENNVEEYLVSEERTDYLAKRAMNSSSILLAGSMTSSEFEEKLLDQLSSYGVTKEKYNSFDFTYDVIKHKGYTSAMTYHDRLGYEISLLDSTLANEEYEAKVSEIKANLELDIAGSLLDKLPAEVSEAIEEIGQMDLYSLIVGSIFFKMAGLLLPIIYMIMVSNNLIAGQVDSGSMAYVLSTSTKRNQVTFTQGLFLISSLFLMFVCTFITSSICLGVVNIDTNLTFGKLALINLGAFLVLFAMSGINFFTSCIFDRSKKAMAIGGGLSMFFLVATMLGLFGSPVIPSVVRLTALNNFNYVSIISLFDVVSILDGTTACIWKLVILLAIGLVGYIVGANRFKCKDLPL